MAHNKTPLPPRWFAERIAELTDELNGAIEFARSQGHEVVTEIEGGMAADCGPIVNHVQLRDDRAAERSFDPAD